MYVGFKISIAGLNVLNVALRDISISEPGESEWLTAYICVLLLYTYFAFVRDADGDICIIELSFLRSQALMVTEMQFI